MQPDSEYDTMRKSKEKEITWQKNHRTVMQIGHRLQNNVELKSKIGKRGPATSAITGKRFMKRRGPKVINPGTGASPSCLF
jgi:hypothetical protein